MKSFISATADFAHGGDSPERFLAACLASIEALEPQVRAFSFLDRDEARIQARMSAQRWAMGLQRSPIDGMPVGVKDIIDCAGCPTAMNSPLFAGHTAARDAACVARLRAAGAILLGKTVTTEFALGRSGPTTNPHDPRRTPGGSSSGSAAAVGAGMLPAALGTQTLGSLLRPASFCGVVAYKPAHGAIPMEGIHPAAPSLDDAGVLGASLGDVGALASVLQDTAAIPIRGARPARLAVLQTAAWREVEEPAGAAFWSLVDRVVAAGVQVVTGRVDEELARFEADVASAPEDALHLLASEMAAVYRPYVLSHPGMVDNRIQELISLSETLSAPEVEAVRQRRARHQGAVVRWLEACDGIVTLSASGIAPLGLENTGSRTFASYASWLGVPALSLPMLVVDGLPVGVQLLGRTDNDLFRCGSWLESLLPAAPFD